MARVAGLQPTPRGWALRTQCCAHLRDCSCVIAGMSRPAYFVGPWDLNRSLSCVPDSPSDGTVVLVESVGKSRALPYHKKKLVLVLSAARHFAQELREAGYDVHVVRASSYVSGIAKHVVRTGASKVIALEPREFGLDQALRKADAEGTLGASLELRPDGGPGGHFLLSRQDFLAWARGRKTLRMDPFYRWQRKETGWLMGPDRKPVGGKWSLDADNRKAARGVVPPERPGFEPDALTREVMAEVAQWPGHWGEVDGFRWPVTRSQALTALDGFVTAHLPRFGDYQDAMLADEPWMWHMLISPALNLSLLHPREVCEALLEAHARGTAPLNAVEGALRQVMGWREFIRGVYWARMPQMRSANTLDAHGPLPALYWEPEKSPMRCMRQSAQTVYDHGYAHHIQRLMVLGNFALLAGIEPLEVSHWFWAGFVDAFEWVELPNVHGMALYADDGFTTKPYAASGSYINKMSDYCRDCRFDVKKRVGPGSCPFNSMYWRFMVRHRDRLSLNPRVAAIFRSWDRWPEEHQREIIARAEGFLSSLEPAVHEWTFDDDAC